MLLAAAAMCPGAAGAIRATSPQAGLRIDQSLIPAELGESPDVFSLVMWVKRSADDAEPMYLVAVRGVVELLIDPDANSILARLGDQSGGIQMNLPLHGGSGSVPLDEWMLIAVTWEQAAGRIEAWARSEGTGLVGVSAIFPGFTIPAAQGDLTIGRSDLPGTVAQQGTYGLIVVRDHDMTGADFNDLWEGRDYLGPYRMDNTATGGSFNGTAGAAWMVNHTISTNPGAGSIPDTTAALVGGPVTTTNYCVLPDFPFNNAFFRAGQVAWASSGDAAFVYESPFDAEGPRKPFFAPMPVSIGLAGPPSIAPGPSPRIAALAQDAPQGVTRVIVSANSRAVATSDAGGQTFPENYAHGFIQQRLASTVGVVNRPAKLGGGTRFFGYDCLDAPRKTGTVIQVDNTSLHCRAFGQLSTNTSRSGVLGPGVCLYMEDQSIFSMKCRPEAGSLMDGSSGDGTNADFPLQVRTYLLSFPGAGSVLWQPEQAAAQDVAGTLSAGGAVGLDTTTLVRALSSIDGDAVISATKTIRIGGDHSAEVLPGYACYISSGNGVRGISVVESVVVTAGPGGGFTDLIMEKWFPASPAVDSSTVHLGPWAIHQLDYPWAALDAADPQIWRGLQLTASGGPAVVLAYDAFRPDADGWAFGTYGTGGDGYTQQINGAFSDTHHRLVAALQPDIWMEGLAQQGSEPSSMDDFLAIVRAAAPQVEAAWLGESTHTGTSSNWHHYILDNAAAAGVPAVSLIEEPGFGTIEDQAVAGLRHNGNHYSHRGNDRLAQRWLELLGDAAAVPGDIDGDGIVGITDLLAMLGAWGPCPAPCPPACAADVDGDCNVGVGDLLTLLANWG